MRQVKIIISTLLFLISVATQAQIKIGGNVYGGGNAGNTSGSTSVTVRAGDIGRVFGGARQADVGGSAFVNIDGNHASSYIIIDNVYGGNDIAGTIGTSESLPDALTKAEENGVTAEEWNAFVRISSRMNAAVHYTQEEIDAASEGDAAYGKTTDDIKIPAGTNVADDNQKIYIGQLFGGGNGDYNYDTEYTDKSAPNLGGTYLELLGGSIVNVFGGGNKATITRKVVIHLDNPSEVVNHIYVKDGKEVSESTDGKKDLLNEERFKKMGFNYKFTYPNSGSFQIGNLFGGNNKVDMAIRPTWSLMHGFVRNLYSGGNEGRMTSPEGLLLQIPEESTLTVDNIYGGCRKADVRPMRAGVDVPNAEIMLSPNPNKIPDGFAARVRVLGGHVNNVYGGNDISGNVYGGNTVGIFTTIHGDVYGGGNGSYAYTDNKDLKDDLLWGDFYYDPAEMKGRKVGAAFTENESVEALNEFRPNAEQVSIRVHGTEAKPTLIEGAIYIGSNSATLTELTEIANRKVELKIGSYVIADNV
ncbi:MAG: hypothetical protein IJ527_05140, partial [Prevotella sp.]|nr:hypothetical protein [Prevotella sp.]